MSKFIYAFDENTIKALTGAGYTKIKENISSNYCIFLATKSQGRDLVFAENDNTLDGLNILYSDILTF